MQLVSEEPEFNSGKIPNSWPFLLGCQSFQIKMCNISKENIIVNKKKKAKRMENMKIQ